MSTSWGQLILSPGLTPVAPFPVALAVPRRSQTAPFGSPGVLGLATQTRCDLGWTWRLNAAVWAISESITHVCGGAPVTTLSLGLGRAMVGDALR